MGEAARPLHQKRTARAALRDAAVIPSAPRERALRLSLRPPAPATVRYPLVVGSLALATGSGRAQ